MQRSMPFTAAVRSPVGVAPRRRAASLKVVAAVKKGDKAPEFELKNQNGRVVRIKYGGKATVLFFYPKDNTPGCTLEAKAFRDSYAELSRKLGAQVYGISSDGPDSHKEFCSDLQLPFELLSDEGDKVRSLFGVPKDLLGLLPGRQTYVIAKGGTVKLVYNNQFQPDTHVKEVIKALAN